MTPPPEKPSDQPPLANLDNDLGDDWESAFQAEEFMFSPEEEPTDFFLFDENGTDKNEDIAALFGDQEDKEEGQAGKERRASSGESAGDSAGVLDFPSRRQILVASLIQLFQARPPYQRLLICSLPVALVLILVSTLFFQSTPEEAASLDEQIRGAAQPTTASVSQGQEVPPAAPQQQETGAVPPQPESATITETVQQKWQFPTFVILAGDGNKSDLIVHIDLILSANLQKGQALPDDKQTFARDIIYQFYANRPAHELKRFALARGEMITQLQAWFNKQWQNNPFDTIIFSRYQVTLTSPPLAPKVTFM